MREGRYGELPQATTLWRRTVYSNTIFAYLFHNFFSILLSIDMLAFVNKMPKATTTAFKGFYCRQYSVVHNADRPYSFIITLPLFGCRRGSVVRTSVFDWRTFPDLRVIYSVASKLAHFDWYALTSATIDRFSNLFYCLNQENICNNTVY